MRRFYFLVGILLCLTIHNSCTMWQIATTTNRKGPWTKEDVQRYADKFPEVDRLCLATNLDWHGPIDIGYNVFHESGRKIVPEPPVNGCPDPQYDYFFFKALSEGLYDDGDFIDTIVVTRYTTASETSIRDLRLKRATYADTTQSRHATHFAALKPSLSDAVYGESVELSAPFTVIIPFVLSGQRRLQTVLIREYLEAVRKANGDGQFEVWLVYLEGGFVDEPDKVPSN